MTQSYLINLGSVCSYERLHTVRRMSKDNVAYVIRVKMEYELLDFTIY